MTSTVGRGEIYSVEMTNTIGHDEIYSVEMASTVGHGEIYSVGKGIIDVGMVLHIDKTDITVVTTVLHVVKRVFIVVAPYPMPIRPIGRTCRDRPRVCPHPSGKAGINTQSLGPFDQYIASVRRTEVRRTDTGSVPTCGLSAEREFLFSEMGVFAARKSCGF